MIHEISCLIKRNDHKTVVRFGSSLNELLDGLTESIHDARLIVDEEVWRFHKGDLLQLPGLMGDEKRVLFVPSGESSKSLTLFTSLTEQMLATKVRRNTVLFVAGGGVTGDLGGFIASSVLRGLRLIHLPTTVLAMVDSAFGGKTGVNSVMGKNLIGAFYQPWAVLANVSFLKTLPEDEWKNGLGEVLKYGLISDPSILKMDWSAVKSNAAQLSSLLAQCAAIKIGIVERDETETGERAYLNLGHTFAHALEAATHYRAFKHGEAVFYGLLAALYVSKNEGAPVDPDILRSFRSFYSFSFGDLHGRIEELIHLMGADKKNQTDAAIRLVLVKNYGDAYLLPVSDRNKIARAWDYLLKQTS